MTEPTFPYLKLTDRIIVAAARVHRHLPRGLPAADYRRALTAELVKHGLRVIESQPVEVYAGSEWLGWLYLEQWVEGVAVVETVTLAHPPGETEIKRLAACLIAAGAPVGVLFNFGRRHLDYRRVAAPADLPEWPALIVPLLVHSALGVADTAESGEFAVAYEAAEVVTAETGDEPEAALAVVTGEMEEEIGLVAAATIEALEDMADDVPDAAAYGGGGYEDGGMGFE